MYIAEKANRQVRIADEKKAEYAAMGYTIKDMKGAVVAEAPNPKKENESLKKEVANLKAEKTVLEEKLKEALEYAEEKDKKIEELEAEKATLESKIAVLEEKLEKANGQAENSPAPESEKKDADDKGSDAGKKAAKGKQADK